jgi:chemotaxis protein methyltransferase WspC
MIYAEFNHLLKQAMGLDAASIGPSAIERAVQERLRACKLEDPFAYWDQVCASKAELQELIEAVVVPETWFFRDREAFAALARRAREEWLSRQPQSAFRLLSLPCSSGEEPYSMAMALLDAGLPPSRFSIDAVDINSRALAQARRAVYGKNSFRGTDLGFRERHFDATAQGYRVSEAVRAPVRFQHGNLVAVDFLPGAEIYDVIFCRNVLIYFDRATQDRTVKVLQRLLKADGVLYVGPAESGLLLDHHFVSTKVPLAFAFQKADAIPPEAERKQLHPARPFSARSHIVAPTAALKQHSRPAPPAATPQRRTPSEPAVTPKSVIDEAAQLADQGQLLEAAKLCEEQLRVHGPSAPACHLMGLIRNAAGNLPEAVRYFRNTLYLDPNHYEALVHLAFLLEKQGDTPGAQALHSRMRRLEQKLSN